MLYISLLYVLNCSWYILSQLINIKKKSVAIPTYYTIIVLIIWCGYNGITSIDRKSMNVTFKNKFNLMEPDVNQISIKSKQTLAYLQYNFSISNWLFIMIYIHCLKRQILKVNIVLFPLVTRT